MYLLVLVVNRKDFWDRGEDESFEKIPSIQEERHDIEAL